MKKTLFKTFFLAILFAQPCIKSSALNEYYTISVNGKTIPSLVQWPTITNFKKPFEFKAKLVTNKNLYKKYILPFEKYLGLTEKPILFWETQFHNTNGNAEPYFEDAKNSPHSILIPAPAHRYIATILHELVHIYIKKKTQCNYHLKNRIFYRQAYDLGLAAVSFACSHYTTNEFYLFIANVHWLAQILLALTEKSRCSQHEEIICDSYAGIVFQDKAKNLKVIDNDIVYFKDDTLRNPKDNNFITNFIADFCCFEMHPSHQKRIMHLLAMKKLVKEGNSHQIKQWIDNQENILLSSWPFFQSIFTPYL